MYKNTSIFQRKKVIFIIGKNKNITTQFNLNTTILYLKIYIRDRLNLTSKFDLLYNSHPIKINSLPLYKFFKDLNQKSIKFTIKFKNDSDNKVNIKLYEKEYLTKKETNNKLMNNIKTYKTNITKANEKENKNMQRYKSLENLLKRQNEEINKLKQDINEANNRYIKLKQNKLKYLKSNCSFSILSSLPKIPKCLSMESFNTMYLNNSKNTNTFYNTYNTNTNGNNVKERNSFDLIKDLSSIGDTNNNIYVNENSMIHLESHPDTLRVNKDNNYYDSNEIFKDTEQILRNAKNKDLIENHSDNINNNNEVQYQFKLKEHNVNDLRKIFENKNKKEENEIDISPENKEIKEEDTIDFYEILRRFKINNDIDESLKQSINNISDKSKINQFFIIIFKYLDKNDLYSFSLTNKSIGVCALYFLLNYYKKEIIYLKSNYSSLKARYEELFTIFFQAELKTNILLSHNSKSGLRILNSPHYINVYNNPIEIFTKNKMCIFIYRMLYQFTINKIQNDDDNLFMSSVVEEIKTKTAKKKSIRDYIYNLLETNLDFSFDNIKSCKKIMKQYDIENFEGNKLGDMDRPSTIISYVVKDIMEFTGLIKSDDKKKKGFGVFVKKDKNQEENDESFNGLKSKILIVCELIEEEILKCENKCKKTEEIISKYYQ